MSLPLPLPRIVARALAALIVVLCASACSSQKDPSRNDPDWTPSAQQVAELEAAVTLPPGAKPLASYARYYTGVRESGRQLIKGVLVYPSSGDGRSAGSSIVPGAQMPEIFGGGCFVIELTQDVAAKRFVEVHCHGDG
jgi:hypothetical protein